ncbi:DcaP family trimeric outer membrane transporter [Gimesia sp.]|uniref:DcaP family trimeric outer membrane transporter n=1 Tax=Gimesia sp. TaxID=2024833 RepID=UPI003A9128F5
MQSISIYIVTFLVALTVFFSQTSAEENSYVPPAFAEDSPGRVQFTLDENRKGFTSQVDRPVLPPLDGSGGEQEVNPELLSNPYSTDAREFNVGLDLYSAPPFTEGLIIFGKDAAMKIGGLVKADFIYDFNPIDSTDSFVTTSIPIGAPHRTNARFHARQSRLSFDTRWLTNDRLIRVYVEGDFFSEGNRFRLRHAFGESGSLLVGQTWTTFANVAAAPATLDFEGSVSSVNRRQAQARWTQNILNENTTFAVSVEDTYFNIEPPTGITGDPSNPSPDFVTRLRYKDDCSEYQAAGLYRVVGFQPTGQSVRTAFAWGFNMTGVRLLTDQTKVYSQIVFGEGIGSYRDLPDAAPTAVNQAGLLPMFGWMAGLTHDWNEELSSNFTYAENSLSTSAYQARSDVKKTTYLAANLIWSPVTNVKIGIEYLFGTKENVGGATGDAHRLQTSFILDLP